MENQSTNVTLPTNWDLASVAISTFLKIVDASESAKDSISSSTLALKADADKGTKEPSWWF
ncbi:hypothetical protein [Dictyobacter kobayashii]|uniref:Uncharacterized protein n=1 Tax=Dictyobacter kobayashii TaxID=2014872 RepID=A0A402AZA2_9CHLR|nr:hypothetical protein [Dictyobacter kobayashii]GCE24446.1 hypothetical protein KDK_82460 [Dictyobacter kobayashii]